MDKLIRTAALELAMTSDKQVVKIAGIMRRLKNWMKSLTDKDYSEEIDQIRSDSGVLQGTAADLNKRIEDLLLSIKDGDVEEYHVILNDIRELSNELVKELQALNKDVVPKIQEPIVPIINSEPTSVPQKNEEVSLERYDREMWKNKEKQQEIALVTENQIKKRYPEHDVPFSKNIETSISNFKWFQRYLPNKIHLKEGNQDGGRQNILRRTADLLARETKLSKEEAIELLSKPEVMNEFFARLKIAVLNGVLKSYWPAIPSLPKNGGIKFRPIGDIHLSVKTAVLEIPVINVKTSMLVGLTEVMLTQSEPKLVMSWCQYAAVSTNGVADEWKKSYLQEPKKQSSVRKEILKVFAGVNPSASHQLSNQFWIKFVQMCDRLGAKPEDLAKVIFSESGFDPQATNVQDNHIIAKGLNQLIKKTALSLGMTEQEWNNYEHIPAENQLPYVEKYFHNVGKATNTDGNWTSATQLYVANFAPKYVHKAADPHAVLYSDLDNHDEYVHNKGLDRERKGHITAGDLAKSVQKNLPDYILSAIDNAKTIISGKSINNSNPEMNDEVDTMINSLYSNNTIESIVKNSILKNILPTSTVLISISSLTAPLEARLKFAKSICYVLNSIINADTSIHCKNDKLEIQCQASGSLLAVANATKALCDCVSDVFELNKEKPIVIKCYFVPGSISKFAQLNL